MIENAIRQFIAGELSANGSEGHLSDDYPLLERNILDSLGLFQLVAYLESQFGIEVQDEELIPQYFGTIGDIARLVQAKRA